MVVLSAAGSGDRRWGGDEVAQDMQDGTVEMVAASDSPGKSMTRRIRLASGGDFLGVSSASNRSNKVVVGKLGLTTKRATAMALVLVRLVVAHGTQ